LVGPGIPIVRLVSRECFVRFAVEPNEVDELAQGEMVTVEAPGWSLTVAARIERIAPEVDPVSGMLVVEAALPPVTLPGRPQTTGPGYIRPGTIVRVRFVARACSPAVEAACRSVLRSRRGRGSARRNRNRCRSRRAGEDQFPGGSQSAGAGHVAARACETVRRTGPLPFGAGPAGRRVPLAVAGRRRQPRPAQLLPDQSGQRAPRVAGVFEWRYTPGTSAAGQPGKHASAA